MATPDNLVKLGQLQTSLQRVKTELDALDGRNFGGVTIANHKLNLFATSDTTKTPLASVDLPEELFLDQVKTTFVDTFNFANGNYTGATDPNLDGKPVLVLAVKGDNTTNPTLTYSFINLEKLVDTYTAANAGISIAGYSIGAQLSQGAGNLLELENDGLFVGSDDTKVDKVTNAVTDNFAIFGASGAVVDSGFTIAGDSAVNSMLTDIFGASNGD